jgi:enterochelin esterase family protein
VAVSEVTSRPAARSCHGSATIHGKWIVIGGRVGYGARQFGDGTVDTRDTDDVWEFDFATELWRELRVGGDHPGEQRSHGIAVVASDRLILYGGRSETAPVLSTTYELQIRTISGATACTTGEHNNMLAATAEREKLASMERAQAWAAAPTPERPSPTRYGTTERETAIGPDYVPAPELARAETLDEVNRGIIHTLMMQSADSSIYPGIERKPSNPNVDLDIPDPRMRGLGLTAALFMGDVSEVLGHAFNSLPDTPEISRPAQYSRKIIVYLPAGLDKSKPAPFIVVNDGPGYVENHGMTEVMDTLIHEGRLPHNLIAIFVAAGGDDAQGSQRGLEYDNASGQFAEFIDTEVLPFVSEQCGGVALTDDPNGRATVGGSSGGCASFSMAWFRPDLFTRVLAYSATLTNQQYPYDPELPHGHWELHSGMELIANTPGPPKPLKIILYNPALDSGYQLPAETYHNWTMANTRTAAMLAAKGYDYRHVFCEQAGHVDGRVVQQTLAGGLEWLWQDYEDAYQ